MLKYLLHLNHLNRSNVCLVWLHVFKLKHVEVWEVAEVLTKVLARRTTTASLQMMSFSCSFRTATDPAVNRAEDVVAHTHDREEVTVGCKCRPRVCICWSSPWVQSAGQTAAVFAQLYVTPPPPLAWPGPKPGGGLQPLGRHIEMWTWAPCPANLGVRVTSGPLIRVRYLCWKPPPSAPKCTVSPSFAGQIYSKPTHQSGPTTLPSCSCWKPYMHNKGNYRRHNCSSRICLL